MAKPPAITWTERPAGSEASVGKRWALVYRPLVYSGSVKQWFWSVSEGTRRINGGREISEAAAKRAAARILLQQPAAAVKAAKAAKKPE